MKFECLFDSLLLKTVVKASIKVAVRMATLIEYHSKLSKKFLPHILPSLSKAIATSKNQHSAKLPIVRMFDRSLMQFQVPDPSNPSIPSDLFSIRSNRYVRKNDENQMLVFVDGSCRNNGSSNPRAGWAVCVGPSTILNGRLEPRTAAQTSNRAEIQSAIAALEHNWGFSSIVIASDSEYVTKGYCEWFDMWEQMDWKNRNGTNILNVDLWNELDFNVRHQLIYGTQVYFWNIPRKYNLADKYAKQAVVSVFSLSTRSVFPHQCICSGL